MIQFFVDTLDGAKVSSALILTQSAIKSFQVGEMSSRLRHKGENTASSLEVWNLTVQKLVSYTMLSHKLMTLNPESYVKSHFLHIPILTFGVSTPLVESLESAHGN